MFCNGTIPLPRRAFRFYQNEYTFSIENQDCTSTYSWHIVSQSGLVFQQSFGPERKFIRHLLEPTISV